MKKNLFLSILIGTTLSSCAMFSSDSSPTPAPTNTPVITAPTVQSGNCTKPTQMAQNNIEQIKAAFRSKDGCTLGKLQIDQYNLTQANLACFPGVPKGEYVLFKVFDKLDTSIDPVSQACTTPKAKVVANSQKIKAALLQKDACTAGNVELETLELIRANPSCFPKEEQSLDGMLNAINEYKVEQVKNQQDQ